MMLGDVCNIIMGQAPSGSSYNEEEVGLPLIAGAGDLGAIYPTPTRFTSSPGKKSIVGDIILCIRATIGTKNWADKEYCLGRGVAALRPKDPTYLIPSYLWHWVSATEQALIRKGKGATFLQVSKSDIEELPCNLPQPKEQQRIAAILDKADALRRKRADSLKLADEFLKSVFLDMFGDPVTNEKGWEKKAFSTFSSSRLGKMRDEKFITGNYLKKYLGNSNVQWFRIETTDLNEMDFKENEQQLFKLEHNDLLICEGGDIGRCAIWRNQLDDCYFQKALHRVRIDKEQGVPDYISYVMLFYSKNGGFLNVTSKATIAHLTGEKLKNTFVPLPPLDLQNKFATIVQKVEAHKQRAMQGQQEADDLFKALQQQFFG